VSDGEFYTEPLIGYRIWSIGTSPICLTGIVYTSVKWDRGGPTHAKCMKAERSKFPGHSKDVKYTACNHPPEYKCNDGLFAFYDFDRLRTSGLPFTHTFMAVRGTVQGWGKVILHEDGYRAEYAQPIALIEETEDTMNKWVPQAFSFVQSKISFEEAFNMRKSRVELVAENYGIPVIPEDDIEEYSRQYGAPTK
jgi:hypothetical protein